MVLSKDWNCVCGSQVWIAKLPDEDVVQLCAICSSSWSAALSDDQNSHSVCWRSRYTVSIIIIIIISSSSRHIWLTVAHCLIVMTWCDDASVSNHIHIRAVVQSVFLHFPVYCWVKSTCYICCLYCSCSVSIDFVDILPF